MKKTAITLSIEELELIKSNCPNDEPNGFYHGQYLAFDHAIELLKKHLDTTEREQIEEAHLDGQKRAHSASKEVSELYYINTYKNGTD